MGEFIHVTRAVAVATVTLHRPERRNAMNEALLEEAQDALETLASDEQVRAVVLTGSGRDFCVGGDLSEGVGGGVGTEGSVEAGVRRLRSFMRTSQLLREMPKVTIAAINGACAGAGLSWACAADLRYAAEGARFNTAFRNAGLSGDFGGTWTLSHIAGPAKARELYLLAQRFDAAEAAAIGLVSDVFPADELLPAVQRVAEEVAAAAPLAVRAIKRNLNDALEVPFTVALDREASRRIRCGRSADAREATDAFLGKRNPSIHWPLTLPFEERTWSPCARSCCSCSEGCCASAISRKRCNGLRSAVRSRAACTCRSDKKPRWWGPAHRCGAMTT